MEVKASVPAELKRLINFVLRRDGDCESLYNHRTWYGHEISCLPMKCSYGWIGYSIRYRGWSVSVDVDFDEIDIYK